ncbi:ATPase [Xylanibacillus composti]|uniref:SRPBCC domain-containing protein n=1 Tax=Xylanibacillus composti TaxID=1572762 RepID=UPI001BCCD4CD|nr:SRPBCC domain-containing protein [Xylanibacillus composti]MDT9724877.1 ATPase [Xylanibacillus composti]
MRRKTRVTKVPERRELIVERMVSIPRSVAWQGWTRPKHVERWWGPRTWCATVYEMDVRPGGIWRYLLAPENGEGEIARGMAVYEEVTAPSRLAYTDAFADPAWQVVEGSQMPTTVTFEEAGQHTLLTITTRFGSVADLEAAESTGMIEGFTDALERLEEYLHNNRKGLED